MISQRTKAALAAAKARGTVLGNPRLAEARAGQQAAAAARAEPLRAGLAVARGTLREQAIFLNLSGFRTATGKLWTPTQVRRARHYLGL